MASQKLAHYLRACRKRSGLSQSEVAYLLGANTRSQLSRYERRSNVPSLRSALAFEALFGMPVSEIFAGTRESVEDELKPRMRKLVRELQSRSGAGNGRIAAQKVQWLVDHCADKSFAARFHEKGSQADSLG